MRDNTIDSYTMVTSSSIGCSHTNYFPTKSRSLHIRIIIISWNDFSWLNGTCTINSKQQTDFQVVIVGHKVVCNSRNMQPLACCFRPRYLTLLGWDDISRVGTRKGDLCALIDSAYYKTINLLACDFFFCENCGKFQVDFKTFNAKFVKSCLSLLARLSRDHTIRYILVLIDDVLTVSKSLDIICIF